jgi:WD40 repeat protein
VAGLSSLAFSASGRLLFGAYYDNTVQVWDAVRCERIAVLFGHESRVSSIGPLLSLSVCLYARACVCVCLFVGEGSVWGLAL